MGNKLKIDIFPFIKKNFILIIIGVVALILLLFAGDFFSSKKNVTQIKSEYETNFVRSKEENLKDLLEKINGVGKCKVMISIECGYEYVYAKDISGSEKIDHVIVANAPVIVKKMEPKIEGVAIVCEGGDSAGVKLQVCDVVSTLFNLPKSKITITK